MNCLIIKILKKHKKVPLSAKRHRERAICEVDSGITCQCSELFPSQ
jgi:hypothetical protein